MALRIKKAEIIVGDKKKVFLVKDVVDMGFIGQGAFVVQQKDGGVESFWYCPTVLYQEEVPDLVDVSGSVVNDGS
jgi:hypothetical protein